MNNKKTNTPRTARPVLTAQEVETLYWILRKQDQNDEVVGLRYKMYATLKHIAPKNPIFDETPKL